MKTALIFDTETTGLPLFEQPSDHPDQPHLVQLGALLVDLDTRRELASVDLIMRPDGWVIGEEVSKIHGITHELAMDVGVPEAVAVDALISMWRLADGVTAFGWHTTSPSMHASCASP
jgi:DNA polymerase-3 subunit epsilon